MQASLVEYMEVSRLLSEIDKRVGLTANGGSKNAKLDRHGQRVGAFTLMHVADRNEKGELRWLCICNCGAKVKIFTSNLAKKNRNGCCWNCLVRPMKRGVDLSGRRFGKLVVVKDAGVRRIRKFECRCDCGNACVIARDKLVTGHTKSCGCLILEVARKPPAIRGVGFVSDERRKFERDRKRHARRELAAYYVRSKLVRGSGLSARSIPNTLVDAKRIQIESRRAIIDFRKFLEQEIASV
jgi:hypothetical protein